MEGEIAFGRFLENDLDINQITDRLRPRHGCAQPCDRILNRIRENTLHTSDHMTCGIRSKDVDLR